MRRGWRGASCPRRAQGHAGPCWPTVAPGAIPRRGRDKAGGGSSTHFAAGGAADLLARTVRGGAGRRIRPAVLCRDARPRTLPGAIGVPVGHGDCRPGRPTTFVITNCLDPGAGGRSANPRPRLLRRCAISSTYAYIAGSPIVLSVNPASGREETLDQFHRLREEKSGKKPLPYSTSGVVGRHGAIVQPSRFAPGRPANRRSSTVALQGQPPRGPARSGRRSLSRLRRADGRLDGRARFAAARLTGIRASPRRHAPLVGFSRPADPSRSSAIPEPREHDPGSRLSGPAGLPGPKNRAEGQPRELPNDQWRGRRTERRIARGGG